MSGEASVTSVVTDRPKALLTLQDLQPSMRPVWLPENQQALTVLMENEFQVPDSRHTWVVLEHNLF